MAAWLRYLLCLIVLAHGFIYVRIGSALPASVKGWRGRSWLLGDSVAGDQLRRLVIPLHVTAGVAVVACAMAILFAPFLPSWWRPLAITGAALGVVAFAVFWDGQVRLLFEEGLIGASVSVLLLVVALLRSTER